MGILNSDDLYYDNNGIAYTDPELRHRVRPMLSFPTLGGKSTRRMNRRNTVHLRGTCPVCGEPGMKYRKIMFLKTGKTIRDVWVCKHCGSTAKKEEIKETTYA